MAKYQFCTIFQGLNLILKQRLKNSDLLKKISNLASVEQFMKANILTLPANCS